jgi:hypothetical protein
MARLWIGASGLTFLGFGLYFLLFTVAAAGQVGIELPTSSARIELASFYGGLEIGIGAFLVLAAARKQWHVPALWCIGLGLGCTAVTRVVLTLAGEPDPLMWFLGAAELVAACGSFILLGRLRRSTG